MEGPEKSTTQLQNPAQRTTDSPTGEQCEDDTPSLVIVIKDSQGSGMDPEPVVTPKEQSEGSTVLNVQSVPSQNNRKDDTGPPSSPGANVTKSSPRIIRKDSDLEITSVTSDSLEEQQAMASMWEAEDTLECAFCKQVFVEQGSYLLHLTTHHDMTCKEHLPLHKTKLCFYNSRYQCYNCKLKTKHRVVFREHVRHHVLKTPYKCGICFTDLNSIGSFQTHLSQKVCSATRKHLVLKPTDIVRQVMKMLGPKAPATEHFYAVNKGAKSPVSESSKPTTTGSVTRKQQPAESVVRPNAEDAGSQSGQSSGSNSTPPPAMSVTQLVSAHSDMDQAMPSGSISHASFIKVTRPVLTVMADCSHSSLLATSTIVTQAQSGLPLVQTKKLSTTNLAEQKLSSEISLKTNVTFRSPSHQDTTGVALTAIADHNRQTVTTTSMQSIAEQISSCKSAVSDVGPSTGESNEHHSAIGSQAASHETKISSPTPQSGQTKKDPNQLEVSKSAQSARETQDPENGLLNGLSTEESERTASQDAVQKVEIPNEGWTPVIIGCSSATKPGDLSDGGTATTEIIGGTSRSGVSSAKPDVQEADGIRVIDFTQSMESASTEPASGNSESLPNVEPVKCIGRSADHPIVINDDDLHNATKGKHNKIKIEKKQNGIVLRLFRDLDGDMEDVSQLGLEIRGSSLFCYRCEKSFTNMASFIPHVSSEIHKIFFFHAGLCPVCKLSADVPGGNPCKLARILCRVLAVVFRSQPGVPPVQPKSLSQPITEIPITNSPGTFIKLGAPNIIQSAVSPARDKTQHTLIPVHSSPLALTGATPGSPVVTPQQVHLSPVPPAASQSASQILIVNAGQQSFGTAIPTVSSTRCAILVPCPNPVFTGAGQRVLVPIQQAGTVQSHSAGQILTPVVLAPANVMPGNRLTQQSPRIVQAIATPQHILPKTSLPQAGTTTSVASGSFQAIPLVSQVQRPGLPLMAPSVTVSGVVPSTLSQGPDTPRSDVTMPTNKDTIQTSATVVANSAVDGGNSSSNIDPKTVASNEGGSSKPSETPFEVSEPPLKTKESKDEKNKSPNILGALPDLSNHSGSSSITSVGRIIETCAVGATTNVATPDFSDDQFQGEHASKSTENLLTNSQENEPVREDVNSAALSSEKECNKEKTDQAPKTDQTTPDPVRMDRNINGAEVAFKVKEVQKARVVKKSKPDADRRMFVGKFMVKDGYYVCLTCNFKTMKSGAFRIHLSKHIHCHKKSGSSGVGSHKCNHCPDTVLFNRIGNCPVLKRTMKMLDEVAKLHPAWQLKLDADTSTSSVASSPKMVNGIEKKLKIKAKQTSGRLKSSFKPPSIFLSTEAAKQFPRAIAPKVDNSEAIVVHPPAHPASVEVSPDVISPNIEKNQELVDSDLTSGIQSCQRVVPYEKRGTSSTSSTPLQPADKQEQSTAPNFLLKCAVAKCDFKTTNDDNFRLHNHVKHPTEQSLACAYCTKLLPSVDLLLSHQDEHKGWVYKCSFGNCNFGARKIAEYQYHLREQHMDADRFQCCFCSKVATAIEDILSHTELHVRTHIKCPYCPEISNDKRVIQIHIADQHKDKPKKIVVSTQIIQNLEDLAELHRRESEAPAPATAAPREPDSSAPVPEASEPMCPVPLPQQEDIQEPEQISEPLPPDITGTPLDDQMLSSPEMPPDLEPEVPVEEPYEGYEPKKCDKCTFMATDEIMMEDHVGLHEKSQDKELRFYCRQCPFSSNEVLDYRIHMQHHTGQQTLRVYICANCDFSSMQMGKIEDHLLDIHPDQPFKFEVSQEKLEHLQLMTTCEFCGEYVLTISDEHMKDHIQLYHDRPTVVEAVERDQKPARTEGGVVIESFHCDMCAYSAPSDEDLTLHLKITHRVDRSERASPVKKAPAEPTISSSEKIINAVQSSRKKQALYECDLCDYKTANKKIFIDHHRQHAEGGTMGMYKCEFCPYQSAKYKNLTHHQKIHARQVDEGYKCPYCYYVHGLKSRVSWHISAYHPGKEKNIVEISKGNPVPALIDEASAGNVAPANNAQKQRQAAKKSTTKLAVNQPDGPETSKVYKHSSQVNYEYQGPYSTTSAVPTTSQRSASPTKPRAVSSLPLYLEDDSLRDFERNLPKDMIFTHPVFCPLCTYSNRVRVNMLRHLKTHVKPKLVPDQDPSVHEQENSGEAMEETSEESMVSAAPLPKDFLSFFKRSTELTVFQCRLCTYVHVNGADMVRHFFCEHAVLGCGRCEEHAISLERMREHVSSIHSDTLLDIYLKRGPDRHKLLPQHIAKIDEMDKMTMLEEERSEGATGTEEDEEEEDDMTNTSHIDLETAAVIKHCKKVLVGTQSRYRCKMCDYMSSLQMIKRHVLSVHMKFFPFRCKYCKANSRERYHMQVHIKRVHPGRPLTMTRVRFDPVKHGKIVKIVCLNSNKKRKTEDDVSSQGVDGSESEHSQSFDRSSIERVTPSRESISSLDSAVPRTHSSPVSILSASSIKQELHVAESPSQEALVRRRSTSENPRVRELRDHIEPPRSGQEQTDSEGTPADKAMAMRPKKKYCCAYCDYVSLYLKQDIQRHILLKHLLIHVFMCKKCKFASNNKKQIEQHKKQNKNHSYRDWTEIKDKIVEIHQEDIESIFGFPEGQLTEIQQQLDKIPGLYQFVNTTPKKSSSQSQSTTSTENSVTERRPSFESKHESVSVNTSDYSQFTEFTRNAALLSPSSSIGQDRKGTAMALANVKSQKKASEIKLPKMELFCCSYCDYSSKYGRGDVKKHIMFKHFMNKKYTCEYCGFSTWTEHIIKTHSQTAHPNDPPNIYNFEFEHECIVPIRTTSDQHMIMGVKTPPNSHVQLQKNTLFQCKLCNVEGPNIVKIKIHVVVKHWGMKPFLCPVCGDQRWKRQNILDHLEKEHPECKDPPVATTNKKATELTNLVKRKIVFSSVRDGKSDIPLLSDDPPKNLKCCACDFVAVGQVQLNSHMSSHSVYSCIYCPFQALRKAEVQTHITKDHPEFPVRIKTSMPSATPEAPVADGETPSKKRKQCVIGFSQPAKKKMNYGQKLAIGQKLAMASRKRKKYNDRLYQCKECGHQVENYKNIIEHICKHINYFRFHCSYCTQRTLRAYTMTNHMEQHHPNEEVLYKVNKDEALEEKLKNGYILVRKSPSSTPKCQDCPASCPLCGKRCARLSTLREHIMRELNYRPYLCPVCDYADCTGGRVNFHMRLHQGISGSYKMRIDNKLAGEVQKLIDEAKKNADQDPPQVASVTPPKSSGSLIVRFPKIRPKSKAPVGTVTLNPSKPPSRPPSVTSISSTSLAASSREASVEPASTISTTSEDGDNPKAHRCHLCPYGTNSEKLFKSHLMRTHGKKRWKCNYCDCQTVYRSTLIKHMKDTHRSMPIKLIQLLPAPKTPYKHMPDVQIIKTQGAFGVAEPQLSNLLPEGSAVTVKTEKKTPVKTQQIRNPPKATTQAPLPTHIKVIGPSDDGRYLCSACPYGTTQKKLIKMHLNSHREADLECCYCLKTYRVGYRLRRHSRVRHPGAPIKWKNLTTGDYNEAPWTSAGVTPTEAELDDLPQTLLCCHLCSFTTLTSDALFRHTQDAHPAADTSSVPSRPSSRQSNCSSSTKSDVAVLRCNTCSFTTSAPEELTEHAKTHVTCKRFRCTLCSFTCFEKIDGLRHSARKHPHRKASILPQKTQARLAGSPVPIKQPKIVVQDLLELPRSDLRDFIKSQGVLKAHITREQVVRVNNV